MKFVRVFKLNDKVKRTSQAAGSWVVKVGTVIEVVPAGRQPTKYRTIGVRKHESYVVMAQPILAGDGKRPRKLGKEQVYWPTAASLRAWSGSMAPSATRVSR